MKWGISSMFSNVFYIIKPEGSNLFQLALVDTHQVISTSPSLEGVLDNMITICKRYKDPITLYRVMNNCTYIYSDTTIGSRKHYYLNEHPFSDQIRSKLACLYEERVNVPEKVQNVSTSLKRSKLLKPVLKAEKREKQVVDSKPIICKKKKLIKPIIRKSV